MADTIMNLYPLVSTLPCGCQIELHSDRQYQCHAICKEHASRTSYYLRADIMFQIMNQPGPQNVPEFTFPEVLLISAMLSLLSSMAVYVYMATQPM